MVRGLDKLAGKTLTLGLLLGVAARCGAEEPRLTPPDPPAPPAQVAPPALATPPSSGDVELLRLTLEAEQQKSRTLQKLNEAQRTLNQELQRQLEELRKALESTARDRDERLARVQATLTEIRDRAIRQARENEEAAREVLTRSGQIPQMKKEIEALQQQLLAEQVRARGLSEKNESLAAQVAQLQAAARPTGPSKPAAQTVSREKAPAPTQGKVAEVDPLKQWLVVNLGTNAGLREGQTLELYRIAPDPKASLYLGQVTLTRVTADSAVGRYTLVSPEKKPEAGDAVATGLLK